MGDKRLLEGFPAHIWQRGEERWAYIALLCMNTVCLLQVRQASHRCFQVLVKECECKWRESVPGEDSFACGSCDTAPTQQLDPAVGPSSNISPLTLRGGFPLALPVSLSLFVSLYPYSLLHPDPLSLPSSLSHTAVSPMWSNYTSSLPRFPLERWHVHRSRWEQHICLPGEALASLEWCEHTSLWVPVRPGQGLSNLMMQEIHGFKLPAEWSQTAGVCLPAQEEHFCLTFINRDKYPLCLSAPLRRLNRRRGDRRRGSLWRGLPGLLLSQPVVPLHMCKAVGAARQAGHQEASSARDIHSLPKQICA